MPRHATATQAFINGDDVVDKDQVLLDMADGQFADFEMASLVREATDEEVKHARAALRDHEVEAAHDVDADHADN